VNHVQARHTPDPLWRPRPMSLATFALGMGFFGFMFGLAAACDRL
jgi:hypothetical protein